jgi:hypothetical protein
MQKIYWRFFDLTSVKSEGSPVAGIGNTDESGGFGERVGARSPHRIADRMPAAL